MNLVVARIVDQAARAREEDIDELLEHRKNEWQNLENRLLLLCAQIDGDGSGTLSVKEFWKAIDDVPDFGSILQVVGIQRSELLSFFDLMDADDSGEVEYKEFVDTLF